MFPIQYAGISIVAVGLVMLGKRIIGRVSAKKAPVLAPVPSEK
jgi:hypothetical protein